MSWRYQPSHLLFFSGDDDDSHKNNDTEDDHNNDYDNDKVGAIKHLTCLSSNVDDDDNDTYDDDNNNNDNNRAGKNLDCCDGAGDVCNYSKHIAHLVR